MRVGQSESRYFNGGYSGDVEKEKTLSEEIPKISELKL